MLDRLLHLFTKKFNRKRDVVVLLLACLLLIGGFKICNSPDKLDVFRIEYLQQSFGLNSRSVEATEKKIRIACLVTTGPKYHNTRAKAVVETWGKRCDYLYFVTTDNGIVYPHLNLVYADVPEDYKYSWGKMKTIYRFAFENLLDKVDWFVKMDDDTYMVVENLVEYFLNKNTSYPTVYGRHIHMHLTNGYAEGHGYVVSKGALKRLVEDGLDNPDICPQGPKHNEDIQLAKCLLNLGIPIVNVDDETGEKFHPEDPMKVQGFGLDPGHWTYHSTNPLQLGHNCCSEHIITFHHLTPEWMYTLEMFFYKLRVAKLDFVLGPATDSSEIPGLKVGNNNKSDIAKLESSKRT